jgi:acyl-CoA reductase-like NAD-dependent aldehyde dehydrogenase
MAVGMTSDSSTPGMRLAVREAATGVPLAELAVDDAAAVAAAAARGRAAQVPWAARSIRERGRLLKRARRAIVRDRQKILSALERETGKARFDVVGELMNVCLDVGYFVRRAPRYLRPEKRSARPLIGKRARVVYKPRGLVGIISPWNAPLTLALGDAIPALLAGNAVIIKPSELTPLAVRLACEAMNRVLPDGLLQVLIGAAETGAALVDQVDMICVTGSPGTGQRVMERAAKRLTPVLLELGGKDPMIVLGDADLERAVEAAAWGGCMMTGQVCMSVERVYVEAPVAEEFTRRLVEKMRTLRTGANGAGAQIDYGPFTSPRQVEVVERHLADAVAKGARILTGGKRAGDPGGVYFEPTVVADVDHSMALLREETFGPVVPVMAVASADDAIRLANDSVYGLNASIWTRDVQKGIALAERIESGSVCVNECLLSAGCNDLPFGGVKLSGVGQRHGGAEGIRAFTQPQAMLIEKRARRREPVWFPYAPKRAQQLERLMGVLWGGWGA